MKTPLLLASTSPRRKAILRFAGISFRAVSPRGVVEKQRRGEDPKSFVRRLAMEKALAVSKLHPRACVLGADTAVVLKGKIYGKPKGPREALKILMALQGKAHEVWTGVALVHSAGRAVQCRAEKTRVFFKPLRAEELRGYLKSSEPYDKAGGYAIQGTARAWIRKWEGDYFNVMGLPVQWVVRTLNQWDGKGKI